MIEDVALFEARGLVKRFGTLVANDHVDLTVRTGEIHALLGENGAGKSTLVKMMFGTLQPDAGALIWNGEPVSIRSPFDARALGVGMVFQHFSLFDSLTVAQNIALSLESDAGIDTIAQRAAGLSQQYGLPLDPQALVGDLSAGERQRIEIIRCLMQDPQLVILDEPTSVLTPQEANTLFETLFRLRDEGRSVLYISHRLEEVQRLCSRATIMRQGRVVDACDPREETAASLAAKMVGTDIGEVAAPKVVTRGDVRLSVRSLNLAAPHPFAVALDELTFEVRAGDVLCVAGIAGHGQSELFAALSGETTVGQENTVAIDGVPCGTLGVTDRRALGAAFVAEERLGHGAVPTMPLTQNMLLTRHSGDDGYSSHGMLFTRGLARATQAVISAFDVRKSAPNPPAGSLSGGNLQKFLMGRELARDLRLLVVNQPTWGVDAGAATRIRQALLDLAERGAAVLVISQDLDEVFQIATHIAVIADGRLSEVEEAASTSRERVGLLMSGLPDDRQAA